jgi:hypothetical protein
VVALDRRHEVAQRRVTGPDRAMAAAPAGTSRNDLREVDHE